MNRISDHPSKTDLLLSNASNVSLSDQESNIEENMLRIQAQIKNLYAQTRKNDNYHLSSFGVQSNSCQISALASNRKPIGFGTFKQQNESPQASIYNSNGNLMETNQSHFGSQNEGRFVECLIEEKNNYILALQQQMQELRDQYNAESLKQLESYERTVNSLRQENNNLMSKLMSLEQNLEIQRQRSNLAEVQLREKELQMSQLEEKNMQLRQQIQDHDYRAQVTFGKNDVYKDQISLLESMIVALENQVKQQQSNIKQMEQIIAMQYQQYDQRHENAAAKEQEDENQKLDQQAQIEDLQSLIANLENLNMNTIRENERLQNELYRVDEELQVSRKFMMDEQNRIRYNDIRIKKQYQDCMFFRDLLTKLEGLLDDSGDCRLIEELIDNHKEVSVCTVDEVEIKAQLEQKEGELKMLIAHQKLSTSEMIDQRRQVEILRGALRNCEEQRKVLQDKLNALLEALEKKIIHQQAAKNQYTYFAPKANNRVISFKPSAEQLISNSENMASIFNTMRWQTANQTPKDYPLQTMDNFLNKPLDVEKGAKFYEF